MKQPRIATLLAGAALCAGVASAQEDDIDFLSRQSSGGGGGGNLRAQRNKKNRTKNNTKKEKERRTSDEESDGGGGGGGLCKSIIAVGGVKKRQLHKHRDDAPRKNPQAIIDEGDSPDESNPASAAFIGDPISHGWLGSEGDADIVIDFLEDPQVIIDDGQDNANLGDGLISLPMGVLPEDVLEVIETENDGGDGIAAGELVFVQEDADPELNIPYHDPLDQTLDTEEEFVCELQDGTTVPLEGTYDQMLELRSMLNSGKIISAISSVAVEPVAESQGGIEGIVAMEESAITLVPGSIQIVQDNGSDSNVDDDIDISFRKRRLASNNMYEGDKKFLVVRVVDKANRAPDENAAFLSDKFFGTNGDEMTMKSGFAACSFDKFRVSTDYQGAIDENLLDADGVLEVELDIFLQSSTQVQLRYAAVAAVEEKLGVTLPGPFDHVAFVVEKCYQVQTSCQFAAYAYVNHWLSLYVEDNYKFPGVQMHEIGHNLNFAHSGGLNGMTYTDHTCLMGNPLWSDDVGKMCFNPVKNYQMSRADNSWYDAQYLPLYNSAINQSWSGKLIGVADYNNNPNGHPIALKLETGTSSDWFLGFNRDTGVNSDVVQAGDELTLYKVTEGDGRGYSHSFLKATLAAGKSAKILSWRGTDEDLHIEVKAIDLNASPAWADVEVRFGDGPSPTKEPTPNPTAYPTANPTPNPTDPPVSPGPTANPTAPLPTKLPTNVPTSNPTKRPRTSTPTPPPTGAAPSCGDGMCDANDGEDPDTCPDDCVQYSFKTKGNSNTGESGGQVFSVQGAPGKDICVTNFGIVAKKDGTGEVEVYTRSGDFSGHEEDPSGWELVYDQTVTMPKKEPMNLPGGLTRDITIPAGTKQSFYIWCKKGCVYTRGTTGNGSNKGQPFDGDGVLVINEGVGTKKLFQEVVGSGQYNGEISYFTSTGSPRDGGEAGGDGGDAGGDAGEDDGDGGDGGNGGSCGNNVCDVDESPITCPMECFTAHFNSGEGGDHLNGLMFTIEGGEFSGNAKISALDIMGKKDGESDVKVYTRPGGHQGYEVDSTGWEVLYDSSPALSTSSLTKIPLSHDVAIAPGAKQSFYVWSRHGTMHTKTKSVSSTPESDGTLKVYGGSVIKKNPFEQVDGTGEFRGTVEYYLSA